MDLNRYGNAAGFPTKFDYLDTLVSAVDQVSPIADLPFAQGGIFTPPIGAEIAAMRSVVETAMGLPWPEIMQLAKSVYGLSQAKGAQQTLTAINGVADGALELVSEALKTVEMAADVAEAIPMIGGIVRFVVDVIATAALTPAIVREQAKLCIEQQLNYTYDWCQSLTAPYQSPVGTGVNRSTGQAGVLTPADFFRPVFFDGPGPIASYSKLPPAYPSMWIALCGQETQGFLSQPYEIPKGKKGINALTQRRMWALLKNIRAAARAPGVVATPESPFVPIGDDGNTAFSMLQDIVYNEWRRGQQTKGAEGIDDEIIWSISKQITQRWDRGPQCYDPAAGGMGAKAKTHPLENNCSRFVDLGAQMKLGLATYGDSLAYQFQDPQTGKWNFAPRDKLLVPKTGQLVLSGDAVRQLTRSVGRIDRGQRGGGGTKLLLGAGAAVLGYAAARRYKLFA